MGRLLLSRVVVLFAGLGVATVHAAPSITCDFPAGPLDQALDAFSSAAGLQMLNTLPDPGARTRGARGSYEPMKCLDLILEGTGLRHFTAEGWLLVAPYDRAVAAPLQATNPRPIAETTVVAHSLNSAPFLDPNGILPITMFQQDELRASGASDVGDFLRQAYTMAGAGRATAPEDLVRAGGGALELFGKPATILVDGRPVPGSSLDGGLIQPDLRELPISRVQRIDVLPIDPFTGGANAGVINIVTRRDVNGTQAWGEYGRADKSAGGVRQFGLDHGVESEDGRMQLQLSLSVFDQNPITQGARPFLLDGEEQILANNPGLLEKSPRVPTGYLTNLRTLNPAEHLNGTESSITHVPPGYTSDMKEAPLLAQAGNYDWGLSDTAMETGGRNAYLVNRASRSHGDLTAFFNPTEGAEIYGNLSASWKRLTAPRNIFDFGPAAMAVSAAAPNNPFHQDLEVAMPLTSGDRSATSRHDTWSISVGGRVPLGEDFRLIADLTTWQSSLELSGPRWRDRSTEIWYGTIDVLRDSNTDPLDGDLFYQRWKTDSLVTTSREAVMRVEGAWRGLPTGPVNTSLAFEHRDQHDGGLKEWIANGPTEDFVQTTAPGERSRNTDAVTVSAEIPLIKQDIFESPREVHLLLADRYGLSRSVFPQELVVTDALTSAVGREHASFRANTYTVGFKINVVEGLSFTGTRGTGVHDPSLDELGPERETTLDPSMLADPRRGGEHVSGIRMIRGGSKSLLPEESTTTSIGLVYEWHLLEARKLRWAVNGFWFKSKRNIFETGPVALDHFARYEELFPERVARDAPSVGDGYAVGPITSIVATDVNAAHMKMNLVNMQLSYFALMPHVGGVWIDAMATHVQTFELQPTAVAPYGDYLGMTTERPLEGRATLRFTIEKRGFEYGVRGSYFSHYGVPDELVQNQGSRSVRHQTLWDAHVGYALGAKDGSARSMYVQLGVANVFNRAPRVDVAAHGLASGVVDPRMRTWTVRMGVGL